MAQMISDRRDVQFVLHEQLKVEDLCKKERFGDLNAKVFDMLLKEARNLATKEILPTNVECEQNGCEWEDGKVKAPPSLHKAYKLFCEGEWLTVADDVEVGGQGMPQVMATAALELFAGANLSFTIYPMLGHGAGKLYEIFGTEEQKKLFLPKVYSGEWGGTMCLTEPEAGSDVGALTTVAKRNDDGTYSISGTKIFISAGDHDMVENIIHPVLARIEGDPPGTSGISIFIVPKTWVNEDGSLGEDNDVFCDRIEEKMGLHGSATCQLTFGGQGKCRGLLLGEERKGMRVMFHMMNEERLFVGMQSLGQASAALMYAINYARERKQGRHLLKSMDKAAPSVPIIEHPDIRRMLLNMKATVEGLRSLNYYVAMLMDLVKTAENPEEKEKYQGLVDLLTPICKGYTTERCYQVTVDAVQVYGGYGYTKEYPVEQLSRDTKITTIYEGTTGIQAMDLLGRKLGMKGGKVFMDLLARVKATAEEAKGIEGLDAMAAKVEAAADKLAATAMSLGKAASSDKVMAAFAAATPFMEVMGDVLVSWFLLWRAVVAGSKLAGSAKGKDAAFYDGQVKTAAFYINTVLPGTLGKMDGITAGEDAAVAMEDASFGA